MTDFDPALVAEMLDEYSASRSSDLRHTREAIAAQIAALHALDNASRAETVRLPAEGGGVDGVLRRALQEVIDATRAYLPPDGISKDELINRVLSAADNTAVVEAMK